jgi:hypothetical protein
MPRLKTQVDIGRIELQHCLELLKLVKGELYAWGWDCF